jgi:hypothetical protein
MTASRVITGVLYAHGGRVFAFLDTEQPYDIPGCAALLRRAKGCSGGKVGTITVQMIEDEKFPSIQGFVVESDRPGASRAQFATAVAHLFSGCKLTVRWVTSFDQSGQLLWALIARRLLSEL